MTSTTPTSIYPLTSSLYRYIHNHFAVPTQLVQDIAIQAPILVIDSPEEAQLIGKLFEYFCNTSSAFNDGFLCVAVEDMYMFNHISFAEKRTLRKWIFKQLKLYHLSHSLSSLLHKRFHDHLYNYIVFYDIRRLWRIILLKKALRYYKAFNGLPPYGVSKRAQQELNQKLQGDNSVSAALPFEE